MKTLSIDIDKIGWKLLVNGVAVEIPNDQESFRRIIETSTPTSAKSIAAEIERHGAMEQGQRLLLNVIREVHGQTVENSNDST